MAGDLVYFWFSLPDAEKAKDFYGGLFGWQFTPGDAPDGWNVDGSTPPGGRRGRSLANTNCGGFAA